jgi:hypothetical protein
VIRKRLASIAQVRTELQVAWVTADVERNSQVDATGNLSVERMVVSR